MSKDGQDTPGGKVRIRVRGTATFIRDGDEVRDFEFTGQQPGTALKTNVRKAAGGGELYETTSGRKPQLVAHLKTDKDSADPEADLRQQFEQLTKNLRLSPLKPAARNARGVRYLRNDERLKVWRQTDEQTMTVMMVIDTGQPRISGQLFDLAAEVNKIIMANNFDK